MAKAPQGARRRATPIGLVPARGELDLSGLALDAVDLAEILAVDREGWPNEHPGAREYYEQFGGRLPEALLRQLDALEQRLKSGAVGAPARR